MPAQESFRGSRLFPGRWDLPLVLVLILAGGFAVVAWLSVQQVNTLWDELVDHRVVLALMEHPLWGSGLDGSQARLPMYFMAGVYACFGPSLAIARLVSILIGAATIVLTFYVGRRWFGQAVGLLATILLAISPYFLGFSRTAMTESDAFYPFTILLTLLAFDTYLRHRDSQRLLLLAVALSIALATKFYAIFLVPALMLCDYLHHHTASPDRKSMAVRPQRTHRLMLYWSLAAFLVQFLAMCSSQLRLVNLSIVLWALGIVVLLLGLREFVPGLPGRRFFVQEDVRWLTVKGWLFILPLAGAICLTAFPEHVMHREVPRELYRKLIRWNQALPMTMVIDPARLYAGIILLKLGWPFGVLTVAGLIWAWIRSPREPGLRLLVAVVGFYILILLTLPLRQSFYLMSIYPLLMLLLAAFIVQVTRWLADRDRLQSAWLAFIVTSFAWLIWCDVRVYPDFGLYGYEITGSRWLGAESRGYRNLIQVTNDGTEDALRWCVDNVPAGQRVVSYLWDDHVIDNFADEHKPAFELIRRRPEIDKTRGPTAENADYLLLSLNNEVTYFDAPSAEELAAGFEPIPAHIVWRGRGQYRMPVVQVYKRR